MNTRSMRTTFRGLTFAIRWAACCAVLKREPESVDEVLRGHAGGPAYRVPGSAGLSPGISYRDDAPADDRGDGPQGAVRGAVPPDRRHQAGGGSDGTDGLHPGSRYRLTSEDPSQDPARIGARWPGAGRWGREAPGRRPGQRIRPARLLRGASEVSGVVQRGRQVPVTGTNYSARLWHWLKRVPKRRIGAPLAAHVWGVAPPRSGNYGNNCGEPGQRAAGPRMR